ncbi:MAG: tetratricopeptide repeat protein [Candidatus Omnitrophota bacterium]
MLFFKKIIFFFGLIYFWHTGSIVTAADKNTDVISVFLSSGEIIKGKLLSDDKEKVILERNNIKIEFDKQDIIRIEGLAENKNIASFFNVPFSAVIIKYAYTGSQEGEEILFADFKNSKFRIENNTTAVIGNTKKNLHQLSIYNGEQFHIMDLTQKMGVRMKAQPNVLGSWFGEKGFFPNFIKKELCEGKICNVYERGSNLFYFWQGILLKQISAENITAGAYIKMVRELEFDVPIPKDKFILPENIKIQDMSQIFNKLQEKTKNADVLTQKLDKEIIQISKDKEAELIELAEKDPELKQALEQARTREGIIDFSRILDFLKNKGDNQIIEKVAALDGGADLIKESIDVQGQVDMKKLHWVFSENEEGLKKKKIESIAQSQTLIDLGNVYLQEGKYPDALEKFTKAIELNPKNYFAYYSRAQVYEAMDNYEKAIEDISLIIKEQGVYAKYWDFFNRGNLYQKINEQEKAIDDYHKAIQKLENIAQDDMEQKQKLFEVVGEDKNTLSLINFKANEMASILSQRALSYKAQEEYKKAVADLNKAIKLAENKQVKAQGYFLRGLVCKQLGWFLKMEQDWEKAKSLGSELREGEYKYKKKQGLFIWYYTDGIVKITGNYDQGKENGFFRWYFPDGKVETEGGYVQGKRDGLWNWYDQTGNIKQQYVFSPRQIGKNEKANKTADAEIEKTE